MRAVGEKSDYARCPGTKIRRSVECTIRWEVHDKSTATIPMRLVLHASFINSIALRRIVHLVRPSVPFLCYKG